MPRTPTFLAPISEEIWDMKYRFKAPGPAPGEPPSPPASGRRLLPASGRNPSSSAADSGHVPPPVYDATLDDTFWRVARAAAAREKGGRRARERWARTFHDAVADFGFLPGGRILAGAGTGRAVTLFNCFVMGRVEDDLASIFDGVKESALTMQQGGGIGVDFSTLRPQGAPVRSIGADASGPVSFMDVWDAMCRTIQSAGARRGAMMACLACDHPDIERFVDVKSDPARLTNFNLSVLVSDAFMAAVRNDGPWDLVFGGKVYRTIEARRLWERIMRATYDYAEPGVIFIDRVNARNNLAYCEEIRATNPCGEQPLPPHGACLLGSINLAVLVRKPFAAEAAIDTAALEERARVAVRFLDNVIDISGYPLPGQRHEAFAKRRIGLGVTGLADALALMGVRYGSERAVNLAGSWMSVIQNAAYEASAGLAAEKGAFPLYDSERFLASPNVRALGEAARGAVRAHGIRNGCLTSIAPTGTISLLAGNVSSGIEPIFDYSYRRRVLDAAGAAHEEAVEDFAYAELRRRHGPAAPLPEAFVRAGELGPREHLVMQAAVQAHVDSSISKTINCPEDLPFEAFEGVYAEAYALGLKGCTTYRPGAVRGAVLVAAGRAKAKVPPAGAAAAPRPVIAEPALPEPAAAKASARRLGAVPHAPPGDVVYMSKPLERDAVLAGYTYKLKWPESEHAIYVTINDIERSPVGGGHVKAPAGGGHVKAPAGGGHEKSSAGDGPERLPQGGGPRRRPFEIFINTKNLEHYAWTVALTRMISAVFRRGGDVTFVAEELKAVFDPQGGRWIGGRYVPSLLAAIGEVIEEHMIRIGFIAPSDAPAHPSFAVGDGAGTAEDTRRSEVSATRRQVGRLCPRCSSAEYVREEGCWVCRSCGFSRCG